MSEHFDHERLREVAAELVLGISSGDDRAAALGHPADCAACRSFVLELSVAGDRLLELAPTHEPPVGFESKVISLLDLGRRSSWRSRLGRGRSSVLGAAVAAAGVLWASNDERQLAARYRSALALADGEYFGVYLMHDSDEREAGHVFAYQGDPSWVYVVFDSIEPGSYAPEIVTESGRTYRMDTFELAAGQRGRGATLPVDIHDIDLPPFGFRNGRFRS